MRFVLSEHEWILDLLNTAEWYFVFELPNLAAGQGFSPQVRDSIFASPVVDAEGNPIESDESDDWNEFVRPDIEDRFARDREVVSADIEAAEQTDDPAKWLDDDEILPPEFPDGPFRRVRVPMDHTEQWYSTLNMTRLLMNSAHGLAEDDSRFLLSFFGEIADESISQDKALLLAQYEFYCVIQNILLENIMS